MTYSRASVSEIEAQAAEGVDNSRAADYGKGSDGAKLLSEVVAKNKLLTRNTFVVAGVVVTAIITCIVLVAVWPSKDPLHVCRDSACVEFASDLVAAINTSADPCQDFVEYACGNWRKTTPLTGDDQSASKLDIPRDRADNQVAALLGASVAVDDIRVIGMAKEFYASCRNTSLQDQVNSSSFLADILKLVPAVVTPDNFLQTQLNILPYASPLFSIQTESNNNRMKVLVIRPAGFDLGILPYGSRPDIDLVPKAESYYAYVTKVFTTLRNYPALASTGVATIEELFYVADVTSLDTEQATMTLAQLNDLVNDTELFDFVALAHGTVGPKAASQITPNTLVLVSNPGYMARLSSIMRRLFGSATSSQFPTSYLHWLIIKPYVPFFGEPYRTYHNVYMEAVLKTTETTYSPRFCLKLTTAELPQVVNRMYVDAAFDDKTVAPILKLINDLKTELKLAFGALDFADAASKELLKGKVDAMKAIIGYQKKIKNNTYLNALYQNVSVDRCFWCSLLRVRLASTTASRAELFEPTKHEDDTIPSTRATGLYDPRANFIGLPAAQLQAPLYGSAYTQLQLYSRIAGLIIGHEIGHAFDDNGLAYDGSGNFNPSWLPADTVRQFANRVPCIIAQYSNYSFQGTPISGKVTLGENIADFIGLHVGYRAYRKRRPAAPQRLPGLEGFSDDQLFFMSFAGGQCGKATAKYARFNQNSVHPPDTVRIKGTMAHSPEFAQAFQCKPGTPMNPVKQCRLWF